LSDEKEKQKLLAQKQASKWRLFIIIFVISSKISIEILSKLNKNNPGKPTHTEVQHLVYLVATHNIKHTQKYSDKREYCQNT